MVLWTEDNNFRTQSFHFDNFRNTKFWFENDLFSKNSRDFDRNFGLSRGKIWLWLFYNFQVISSKNEGVTAISVIFVTLIAILRYLEAKFDYGYFIIFFVLWFHDSTQKISSHFEQN